MSATAAKPYTPFSLSVVPHRHEVAVVPVGELDLATSADVAGAVEDLRAAGFEDISVDLRGVDFIDSSGLQMLLRLRDEAEQAGKTFAMVRPSAAVQRLFDVTGTSRLFDWRARFPA